MPSSTYKLELPRAYAVLVFAVLSVFTIVAVVLIVTMLRGGSVGPPAAVVVVWCAILAWNWFFILGIPHRIEFNGPDDIVFISLRKTVRISAASIDSIKGDGGGIYVLRYDGGRIRLVQQFTGFYKLLSAIEAANPGFKTRGI